MMKRLMDLLKKWLGNCDLHTSNPAREGKQNKVWRTLLDKLEAYLFTSNDFRFKELTEQTEYRRMGEGSFRHVEQRTLNTLCIDARSQGINCWD